MKQTSGGMICVLTCWGIGVLGGALIMVLLTLLAGFKLMAGIFVGGVAAVIAGLCLTWAFCRPLPEANEVVIEARVPGADKDHGPAPSASASRTQAPAPSAAAPSVPPPTAAPAPTVASNKVKPTAALAGEAELSQRKGTWKYGDDGGSDVAEEGSAADVPAVSDDKKPELLAEAREGGPDDLKQIKGVGKVMEDMLHGMGIFHFDQVANWSAEEAEWVDANLPKFKGRVARDGWVEQAKLLAAGGQTEFSKKVEKGGVYDS